MRLTKQFRVFSLTLITCVILTTPSSGHAQVGGIVGELGREVSKLNPGNPETVVRPQDLFRRHPPNVTVFTDPVGTPPPTYVILNVATGKVLDLPIYKGNPDGVRLHGWEYNGHDNQRWELESNGKGAYRLKNKMQGKFLDYPLVQNNPNGIQVHGWKLNGQLNQCWYLDHVKNTTRIRIRNAQTEKLLDMKMPPGNPNDEEVRGWDLMDNLQQEWEFHRVN